MFPGFKSWCWYIFFSEMEIFFKIISFSLTLSVKYKYLLKCIYFIFSPELSPEVIWTLISINFYDIFFGILNGYLKNKMLKMELLMPFQKFCLLTFLHRHSATCSTLKPVDYSQYLIFLTKHI